LDGLKLIRQAADENGLKVITEVLDTTLIEEVYQYADILQIGSRNMQNFYFLKVLGKTDKPLMLKRGMYSRIDEWLMAAEYLLSNGNDKVMLCERGIRTFDTSVRNTMDITAIPLVNELSHLPIIADPSHGTGKSSLIIPMTLASIAAGADGIMVEVHPDPENALSDGEQSLNLNQIDLFLSSIDGITGAMNKNIDINIKIN
jgi:3-deoxy-7-phosphoheptulonate synthase